MKPLRFSPDVEKKLKKIQHNNVNLYKRIQKQLHLFINDPHHKSLRLHKIKNQGNLNIQSISIDKNLRMLYTEQDFIYFFDIGTHNEVYRKK